MQAGLTQEELAERAGLTTHAVSALERGTRTRPYPHTVRSLASALALDDSGRARLHAAVPARPRRSPAPEPTSVEPGGSTPSPVGATGAAGTAGTAGAGPTVAVALGVPPTPLLGRDEDRATVAGLVQSGCRLVTLTGPGGVGKTRLAAAVAEELADDHPDGLVVVPLASVAQPSAVVPTLARALGLAAGDGPEALATVVNHLQPQRVLVVLDNMEQLLGAGQDVAHLVGSLPGLTVLITSRAPLRIRGEQEYVVEPLGLPGGTVRSVEELAGSAAGALTLQRARAVNPRLALEGDGVAALAELCHRLSGLPLAIELASVHLRMLSPRQLLRRLDDLTAGTAARDLPERQRTMRATLDWSYGLLAEREQRLLRLLGVFRGGATLDAVQGVLGPDHDALETLSHLVEQSMVVVRPGPYGEPRYAQLEPVAQYARSLLVGDEAAAAVRAHAAYFCGLAEEAAAGYERADQVEWLSRAEADEANLLIAVDRSLMGDPENAQVAARIVWAMWLYWWLRGQVVLGRRKAEACLVADLPPALLGRVRLAAATMSYAGGDAEASAAHWDAALEIAGEEHDPELAAKALSGTGLAALAAGDLARAEERFTRGIDVGPDPRNRTWMESLARIWLGTCLILRGDHAAAVESVQRGLRLARERGDRLTTYIGLYNLSQAALASQDIAAARRHLLEGIELSTQTGDLSNLAYFLEALAVVESAEDKAARVAVLLGVAQSLRESEGANVYAYYQPDEALRASAERAAREELGEDAFDDAVDAGRAMELDEVVALALTA